MIFELLIRLFFGIASLIIGLIPTISLPTNFNSMFSDFAYLVSYAAYFLPISTIVACISLIFIVDNAKFIMSIINWIISKIPTIS